MRDQKVNALGRSSADLAPEIALREHSAELVPGKFRPAFAHRERWQKLNEISLVRYSQECGIVEQPQNRCVKARNSRALDKARLVLCANGVANSRILEHLRRELRLDPIMECGQ